MRGYTNDVFNFFWRLWLFWDARLDFDTRQRLRTKYSSVQHRHHFQPLHLYRIRRAGHQRQGQETRCKATVVATGGAVDNLARIERGQLNLGIGTWATFLPGL